MLAAFFVDQQHGIIKNAGEYHAEERNSHQGEMELVIIDSLVPEDHLLRKIKKYIDFSFINDMCESITVMDNGRPAIEPVIIFKMLFIGYLFGIRSERRLVKTLMLILRTDGFWITS